MKSHSLFIFLLGVFALFVSLPILQAGFFSDDIFNSSLRGAIALAHEKSWPYLVQQTWGIEAEQGRIYPITSFTTVLFFYLFPDSLVYQIVRTVLIWLSIVNAAWLVQGITKNIKISFLLILLLPLFWSIRTMSDPLVSYGAQLALLSIFVMSSLGCYLRFMEKKRGYWWVLSLLAYAAALLTYEPAIATFFCVVLLAWLNRCSQKQWLYHITPFALLTTLYLTACLIVRHETPALYNGIQVGHLNAHAVMVFIYQLTAALPLSYGLLQCHFLQWKELMPFLQNPLYVGILLYLFLMMWMGSTYLLGRMHLSSQQIRSLIGIALPLCVIPSLLMAISIKYEGQLHWGVAYIPVFLQYTGMAFLLICVLNFLRRWRVVCGGVLAFTLCLSWMFNILSVDVQNQVFKYPRELDTRALQAGLLQSLPQKKAMVWSKDPWLTSDFMMQEGGVHADATHLDKTQKNIQAPASQVLFFLISQPPMHPVGTGTVTLGRVIHVEYVLEQGKPVLSGLILDDRVQFSAKGPTTWLVHRAGTQTVHVSWVCSDSFLSLVFHDRLINKI